MPDLWLFLITKCYNFFMPSYYSVSLAFGWAIIFQLCETFINKISMLCKSYKIPPVAKSTGQDFAHVCVYRSKNKNKPSIPEK